MTEKEIKELFTTLDIHEKNLPGNYNPDSYGKELMTHARNNQGVTYSCVTENVKKQEKASSNR